MVAKRTVRVLLTVLVAFAVVTSVIAVPVSAGDDSVLEGDDDDDDPVGISANNDSVSVNAGDDSVTVDSGGVSADTDDTTDAVSSGDEAPTDDASTTAPPAETYDHHPVNYSDVPFWIVPVDLCRGAPEAPDGPELPVDNPTPVNPTDPPGAPFTQCDIFNPYDPPFDPTHPTDDPDANVDRQKTQVGPDGVHIIARGSAQAGEDSPGDSTIVGVRAGEDGIGAAQYTAVSDGSRNYVVYTTMSHEPGTKNGSAGNRVTFLGKGVGANVVCDGETCSFASGTPAKGSIPINGSDDGGDEDTFPCEPPVGPGDAPDSPVDPSNPPEPLPPVENPTPADPSDPPNAPLGICDVYDPNDPPSQSPDPTHSYDVQPGENNTVVRGNGKYNDSEGPTAATIAGVSQETERPGASQRTYLNDGQKSTVVYTTGSHESGTRKGSLLVSFSSTKRTKLIVDCDGEECTIEATNTPLPSPAIPTNSSDDDDDEGSSIPCEPPVGPGDAPDSPVDPSNPPEPLPPVNNPTPLDPSDPPNAPLGVCDVYDPNDPPSQAPAPDHSYDAQPGENNTVVRGSGTYNDSEGPTAATIAGASQETERPGASQRTYLNDGQKDYVVYTGANGEPMSLTKASLQGVPFDGDSFVVVDAFDKRVKATMKCDGEFCTLDSQNAPGDGYQIRISNGSDSDSGDEQTTSSSSDTSTDDSSTDDSSTDDSSSMESDDGEITQSSQSSATSSSSGSTTSGSSSADSSTASVSSPSDTTTMAAADDLPRAVNSGTTGIPSAFQNGLPDAASASEALMALI